MRPNSSHLCILAPVVSSVAALRRLPRDGLATGEMILVAATVDATRQVLARSVGARTDVQETCRCKMLTTLPVAKISGHVALSGAVILRFE